VWLCDEILPLPLLADSMKIKFMQSFVQNFLPLIFNNTWIRNRDHRLQDVDQPQHELRSDGDFYVPFSRLEQFKRFPLYYMPIIWNNLPDSITIVRRKSEFNENIKKMFLSELSSIVNCNRLLCPSCHFTSL